MIGGILAAEPDVSESFLQRPRGKKIRSDSSANTSRWSWTGRKEREVRACRLARTNLAGPALLGIWHDEAKDKVLGVLADVFPVSLVKGHRGGGALAQEVA